ncbi:MAG: ABC transporter permease subunit [Planctomycetes bacterium]|nr:ABC transporter permease subunit [Planctomycetota bacterium]MCC7061372.1 ABC transporter permease subunit [Planctomycetota bacterium]
MSLWREAAVVARLDFAEVRRSRWLIFCLLVHAVLAGTFVLVGLRESGVVGFTGMGRALMSWSHALLFLLPLLALSATGQVVNSARDDGSLELLLSNPVSRAAYFLGTSLVRVLALVLPLLVAMPVMALVGTVAFGQQVPWGFLVRGMAVSTSLLLCFVAIGLLISVMVRNQAKALMLTILVWIAGVALIDFGLVGVMLQWELPPQAVFALAVINPVQCARLALLSAAQPELSTFGPVGFFLANRIGANGLLLLGLGWPLLLGVTAWVWSLASFRRRDLL